MYNSVQMREERATLAKKAQAIITKADSEGRKLLNTEEQSEFDKTMGEVDSMMETISRVERAERVAAELTESAGRKSERTNPDTQTEQRTENTDPRDTPEYRKSWNNYLRYGFGDLNRAERTALSAGVDTKGGYLTPSTQWIDGLVKFVDNEVFMRTLATVETVTAAQSLGVPSLDTDVDDADWTTEIKTGSEDTGMAFGARELTPHPLAKRVKVSDKLLRLSPRAENIVRDRLGYKFGVSQEKAFLTGSGAQQPLGVFVATARGISTGRDVAVTTTGELDSDKLINAFYTLKAQYQRVATGLFSREFVKRVRRLKDSQGRYYWEPSFVPGEPDTILGRPFYMSEYVPDTYTSGLYIGMWADFTKYWIVDALTYNVVRLNELYAETAQVGFIARAEVDGMPVLEEAFVRLKVT